MLLQLNILFSIVYICVIFPAGKVRNRIKFSIIINECPALVADNIGVMLEC